MKLHYEKGSCIMKKASEWRVHADEDLKGLTASMEWKRVLVGKLSGWVARLHLVRLP
jgi:hypothetical protein